MNTKTAMIPDVMVTNEGIQVELWRNRGQSEKFLARGDVHRLLPEEENRKEFCQSLGFLQQADGILPLDPKLIYHEMDEKEKRVWEAFLPTIYYDQNIHDGHARYWATYNFDTIPINVLEEIDFAKKTGLFYEMQIWTPERTRSVYPDPVVVGITVTGRHFLIARWGESLKPFKNIQHAVRWEVSSEEIDQGGRHFFFSVMAGLLAIIATGGMAVMVAAGEPPVAAWWMLPISLLSVPASLFARLWLQTRRILSGTK